MNQFEGWKKLKFPWYQLIGDGVYRRLIWQTNGEVETTGKDIGTGEQGPQIHHSHRRYKTLQE